MPELARQQYNKRYTEYTYPRQDIYHTPRRTQTAAQP